MRCADTADTYDTTHILRFVSTGQFHVPLSPRRSGAVTCPHCPKEQQHGTRQQKHKTCQHTRTCNTQAATTAPCPCDENSCNHGIKNELPQSARCVVCSGAQSDASRTVDTRRANERTQRTSNHHAHRHHNMLSHENGHTVSET